MRLLIFISFYPFSSTHSSNGIKSDDAITIWPSTVNKLRIKRKSQIVVVDVSCRQLCALLQLIKQNKLTIYE